MRRWSVTTGSPELPGRVRIGTRRSILALRQSEMVAEALRAAHAGLEVELVTFVTRGDRRRGSLAPVGGKGLFTAELASALRDSRIDLAVHSAKDLPAADDDGLVLAAVPRREDPRDALVTRGGAAVEGLRPKATVGTASLRRKAQLLAIRGDLQVVVLRGNVETRLRTVLAAGQKASRINSA